MMIVLEFLIVLLLGGSAYGAIEVLWRGHTHWTMVVTGGLCFACMYLIASRSRESRFRQYILCAVVVTTVEFVVGAIVNIGLGMDIWDYSDRRWNLFGQICARYSLYWLILSVPACALSRMLYRGLFRRRG